MDKIKGYVVGFMFRHEFAEVALIRKARPAWQKGKLNGIGGKVEEGESPYSAMCREFKEETGFSEGLWAAFAETTWEGGYVQYFTTKNNYAGLNTTTDEVVDWHFTDLVLQPATDLVPNLRWAIPMAIEWFREPFHAIVDYSRDPASKQILGK
jgi:8-oxo-dGTP diphosphatase